MRGILSLALMGAICLGATYARAQYVVEERPVIERHIIDVERRHSTPRPDFAGPREGCETTTVERVERDGTRVVNREEVCD